MFKTDLFLTPYSFGSPASNRMAMDLKVENGDLKLTDGQDNLSQALLCRFHTRIGELTSLGHPNYGSRLYTLIGEPDSKRVRTLAQLYIRETVEQEPRIAAVQAVHFKLVPPSSSLRNQFIITLYLTTITGETLTLDLDL